MCIKTIRNYCTGVVINTKTCGSCHILCFKRYRRHGVFRSRRPICHSIPESSFRRYPFYYGVYTKRQQMHQVGRFYHSIHDPTRSIMYYYYGKYDHLNVLSYIKPDTGTPGCFMVATLDRDMDMYIPDSRQHLALWWYFQRLAS